PGARPERRAAAPDEAEPRARRRVGARRDRPPGGPPDAADRGPHGREPDLVREARAPEGAGLPRGSDRGRHREQPPLDRVPAPPPRGPASGPAAEPERGF